MQCSVAAGCNGATGKGAKNPLVVGLLNDRLFSPAPVKGGGEEEKKDLKQVKIDDRRASEAKKKGRGKSNSAIICSCILTDFDSKYCDCYSDINK